jgi:hypothetical protein
MLAVKHMNSFKIVNPWASSILARHNNLVQKRAERTRLGIPVTIASDPRHVGEFNPGAAIGSEAFSVWPGPLGLAAIGDTALTQRFGDIARQEYLATGIRLALHPMADLATEPRWGRGNGTFGEDAELSARMTMAYVKGFQGGTIVDDVAAADVVIYRIGSPFEERSEFFLESFFQQGRLWYNEEELAEIFSVLKAKPTVVVANLVRPAILTEIDAGARALVVEFGVSDEAIADVLFGKAKAEGKLPIELPSSREAVENQKEDLPYDSEDPLYRFGAGL